MDYIANARSVVEGEVIEVLRGMGLAHMRGSDGLVYGLRPRTPGIKWTELREGQRFRCLVAKKLHRVLQADALPANAPKQNVRNTDY